MLHKLRALVFSLLITIPAAIAAADEHSTYDTLWHEATTGAECKPTNYSDFTLVTCPRILTLWYFTKPNHPAHPGVIKRVVKQQPNGTGLLRLMAHHLARIRLNLHLRLGWRKFRTWIAA